MTNEGGTYTLVVELDERTTLTVGALGTHTFERGYYAYVGSALGPGGFARVDRHRELATGERDTRHWHVDYLLGAETATLVDVVQTEGVDAECEIAALLADQRDTHDVSASERDTLSLLDGEAAPGFGCSDCRCDSHLYFHPKEAVLRSSVDAVHRDVRARTTD